MGFNKRLINYDRSLSALENNKLKEYYGKSDALFFMDQKSRDIFKLHEEGKTDKEINNIREITDIFFIIISHLGIDVEDLYKRYVVKNQLNTFRQQNGYKEGSYIKIWGGVEDNVVAFDIMKSTDEDIVDAEIVDNAPQFETENLPSLR